MGYILNGQLIHEDSILLPIDKNGSFWYGDGFFEAMKFNHQQILFIEHHWQRIQSSCSILKMANPFKNQEELLHFAKLLANNSSHPTLRLKITFWRNTYQAYQPENDQVHYLITGYEHEHAHYPINITGIKLGIYTDNQKAISKLGNVKSNSSQLYVLATLFTQQKDLHDSVLLNTHGRVIETGRSNLFIIKNNVIYTPPLNEGCLDGIMRRVVLEICSEKNISIQQEPITREMLLKADGIFTSSSIRGIHWVESVDEQTYSQHPLMNELVPLLNEKALST